MILSSTVSIKAAVFRFSGVSTPWTGKGSPHRKLLTVFLTRLSPGAIILLHAGAKHSASALPLILQQIKSQGYEIVPVGELIYPNSKLVDPSGMQLKP